MVSRNILEQCTVMNTGPTTIISTKNRLRGKERILE